jgi:hypothetical protein
VPPRIEAGDHRWRIIGGAPSLIDASKVGGRRARLGEGVSGGVALGFDASEYCGPSGTSRGRTSAAWFCVKADASVNLFVLVSVSVRCPPPPLPLFVSVLKFLLYFARESTTIWRIYRAWYGIHWNTYVLLPDS